MPSADDADGLPMAWSAEIRALGEGARDRLLNADRHTGGYLGLGEEDALAELQAKGLASPKGNLTRAGAALAREIQDGYWPNW